MAPAVRKHPGAVASTHVGGTDAVNCSEARPDAGKTLFISQTKRFSAPAVLTSAQLDGADDAGRHLRRGPLMGPADAPSGTIPAPTTSTRFNRSTSQEASSEAVPTGSPGEHHSLVTRSADRSEHADVLTRRSCSCRTNWDVSRRSWAGRWPVFRAITSRPRYWHREAASTRTDTRSPGSSGRPFRSEYQ